MLKVIEVFMEQKNNYNLEELISCAKGEMSVSYTHLRAHRDRQKSRMPSSA